MNHSKSLRLFAGMMLLAGAALAAQEIVEEIVAVVNDEIITLSDFKREYAIKAQQAQAQLQGDELEKALAQVKTALLDAMITDRLLLQMAKEKNFNITEQLKMTIDNIKKENGIETDEELRRAVRGQGLDYDTWLKDMEETILKQSVIYSEVNKSLVIDEAQVIEYYKSHKSEFVQPAEYKVRAVYLSLTEREGPALEAYKAEITGKIKGGLDFTQAAETYSDAPLKETKGDLGTLVVGQIDKTLETALEPLKSGEISNWIQAKNGWYMLRVEDRKESRTKSFEEAKRDIEQKMTSALQEVKFKEFMQGLKKRSFIKILKPNPLDDKRP
jgi:peptidyl-prolyl cis-trans isomerase SurA